MRILFDNYTTLASSESSYLHRVLNQSGIESAYWADKRISTYDILDSVQPNVFVTHYRSITQDLLTYLQNNNKVDLVLNIGGIAGNEMSSLEGMIKELNIKCPLVFSGDIKPVKPKELKFEEMLPAADLFFPITPPAQSNTVSCGVVCQSKNDLVTDFIKDKEVYHLLGVTSQKELSPELDLAVDIRGMCEITHIYNQVVLVGNIRFVTSQLFFDALLRANKCSVITSPSEESEWSNHLQRIFNMPKDGTSLKEALRGQVLQRHNCFSRAERLMRLLGDTDATNKIQKIKNNLPNMIGIS